MRRPSTAYAIVAALLLAGCTPHSLPELDESFPFSLGIETASLAPQLSQSGNRTMLSWLERDENGATLRFAEYQSGKWISMTDVVSDEAMFVNWADLPGVTPLPDGALLAHWLRYNADGPYSYDVLLSRSEDNGTTWSAPVSPHDDGTPTEHGFVSVYTIADKTGLIWLDGRNTPDGGMTLRTADVDAALGVSNASEMDALVCDCCQTDVTLGSNGPVAVYRNRTSDEVRDIYVSRQIDGRWLSGTAVANDGWVIEGCPVNGPVIAALGDTVIVGWFTGANETPKVKVAISVDGGQTFAEPLLVASHHSTGHVGLAMIDEQSYAVSWMTSDRRDGYNINIQTRTVDGQAGPVRLAGKTRLLRTVPQLVRHADELLMAWSDQDGDATQVVSVQMTIRGFYDAL